MFNECLMGESREKAAGSREKAGRNDEYGNDEYGNTGVTRIEAGGVYTPFYTVFSFPADVILPQTF
jgi:hypothetical protein